MRSVALESQVDEKTIRNCVRKENGYKSNAIEKLRSSDFTVERRSNKAAWVLRKLRHTLAKIS